MAAPKKRGLGKGLDALFGDVEVSLQRPEDVEPAVVKENDNSSDVIKASAKNDKKDTVKEVATEGNFAEGIEYIDINLIKPNVNQPRKTFDQDKLEELAASIKEHGLIQPVVVRKAGKGYEIVAGERRWRAARIIGLKEVPCIVRELSDEENMLLAIIENMQRENLNPIEEAEGLKQIVETYGLTQEQVSKSVGKSRPYITNSLRLLKLPETIIGYIAEGQVSAGHAKVIGSMDDEQKQIQLIETVIKEGLSVRQLEQLMGQEKKPVARKKPAKNANVKKVEDDLKNVLGTKVTLNQNKTGNKGKIEIEFYSREELERLIELLKTLS